MLFVVLGGLAISIQVPTNAVLSKHVGALQTTLMSFMLDLCLLALIVAVTGSFPGMAGAATAPIWEFFSAPRRRARAHDVHAGAAPHGHGRR